ncbi:TfoX/Sxy family DNA transformation protein [Vibrio hippocampi]|uniref:DNA transformation protein n=1 Tax=Vibrio hippocampi TaxID=654686 RepID=A0ABM8ZHU5_9VIBR|nr:TfoX/Sxy family DNA transformation protein [Vibrio hippocampi]CAH0526047.1 hypothetical protein VHP8226_01533 [Vibrio hippocampi]
MKHSRYDFYINQYVEFTTRSMFGGLGLFHKGAMFALVADNLLILRGGKDLSCAMNLLGCKQYRQVKKRTIASVDYFDVTALYDCKAEALPQLIIDSAMFAFQQKKWQSNGRDKRIRELINLQFSIERMLSKVGVIDLATLQEIGAAHAFSLLKRRYGEQVNAQLLWKLAAAIEGIHWWLLQEPKKKQLWQQYRKLSFGISDVENSSDTNSFDTNSFDTNSFDTNSFDTNISEIKGSEIKSTD